VDVIDDEHAVVVERLVEHPHDRLDRETFRLLERKRVREPLREDLRRPVCAVYEVPDQPRRSGTEAASVDLPKPGPATIDVSRRRSAFSRTRSRFGRRRCDPGSLAAGA
jgi:hypothetical protein